MMVMATDEPMIDAHNHIIQALHILGDLTFPLCSICGQYRVTGWSGEEGEMCLECANNHKHSIRQPVWREFRGDGLKKAIERYD